MIKFIVRFIEATREASRLHTEEAQINWAVHRKAVAH